MKKIFSFLAIAAIVASCAKTEPVYTEDNSEIRLAPVTTHVTKANVLAAIDGTEYPTAENFDVYAYWSTADAGSTFTDGTLYLGGPEDAPKAVEFTNKGAYWGGVTTYYWPKNGSLRFAAYSPADLDLAHSLTDAGDVYSVTGYVQPNETAKTWDLLVAPTSVSYNAMTAAENVSVKFQHGLSWITLQVKAKDAEAAKAFDVKKVTINDVVTTADLTASMNNEVAKTVWNWDLKETKDDCVVYTGSKAVTETATVIENTTAGTLVIPQATTSVTVDYTQNALDGTPALEGQSVTVDLVLDTDNTPWEPGKHYIYTLIFGLDEILINPSVVDWEDVEVGEIDTDKTVNSVSTEAQFVAALIEGGKIVLQDNVTVTGGYTIGNDVVIDLNGKTLTSTTNDIMFRVNGSLTINGEGKVVSPLYAASANAGGVVIVNGGEYNCLTTCFQANGGKVIVNAGKFEVTDESKKYTLNHIDSQKYNGLIEVTGGTFVGYNPAESASENPVMNFVKAGYAVVADGANYTVVGAKDFAAAVAEGGEFKLYTDLVVDTPLVINANTIINLNGCNITAGAFAEEGSTELTESYAFWVKGGELTINGEGDVKTAPCTYSMAVWANGGKVTINGGNYYNAGHGSDLIYVSGAGSEVVINGGYFEPCVNDGTEDGTDELYSAINLKNNGKAGEKAIVYGGTFYGFNPADNVSENPKQSFVAEGYKVVAEGILYTVVKAE